MTNLELMICEAENNGEIDLDTRDIMLSILNESTAQARRSNPLTTKADSLRKSADDDARQAVNHELIGSMKSKIKAQKLRKQATNEWDNASKLDRAADKYDVMHLADLAYRNGKEVHDPRNHADVCNAKKKGRALTKMNEWRGNSERDVRKPGYKDLDTSQREKIKDIYDKINKSKMKKDKAQELKKEIDNMRLSPRKRKELNERIDILSREHELNKEKRNDLLKNTRNTVKESVLEEIYEAELCGDITPEERMVLIDYMNM